MVSYNIDFINAYMVITEAFGDNVHYGHKKDVFCYRDTKISNQVKFIGLSNWSQNKLVAFDQFGFPDGLGGYAPESDFDSFFAIISHNTGCVSNCPANKTGGVVAEDPILK